MSGGRNAFLYLQRLLSFVLRHRTIFSAFLFFLSFSWLFVLPSISNDIYLDENALNLGGDKLHFTTEHANAAVTIAERLRNATNRADTVVQHLVSIGIRPRIYRSEPMISHDFTVWGIARSPKGTGAESIILSSSLEDGLLGLLGRRQKSCEFSDADPLNAAILLVIAKILNGLIQ